MYHVHRLTKAKEKKNTCDYCNIKKEDYQCLPCDYHLCDSCLDFDFKTLPFTVKKIWNNGKYFVGIFMVNELQFEAEYRRDETDPYEPSYLKINNGYDSKTNELIYGHGYFEDDKFIVFRCNKTKEEIKV